MCNYIESELNDTIHFIDDSYINLSPVSRGSADAGRCAALKGMTPRCVQGWTPRLEPACSVRCDDGSISCATNSVTSIIAKRLLRLAAGGGAWSQPRGRRAEQQAVRGARAAGGFLASVGGCTAIKGWSLYQRQLGSRGRLLGWRVVTRASPQEGSGWSCFGRWLWCRASDLWPL